MADLIDSLEGPGLPLMARLYTNGRYTRASVDTTHHGRALTYLDAAGEWRQKAMLRKAMLDDLTTERDALQSQIKALEADAQRCLEERIAMAVDQARLEKAMQEHNDDCEQQCKARKERGPTYCYMLGYERDCGDCPRDGKIEIPALRSGWAAHGSILRAKEGA